MRTALQALAGVAVLSVAAVAAASFQSAPTLIDRALPLLILAIWGLGWLTSRGLARDTIFLLVPLILAVEIGIRAVDPRMLLIGGLFATAAVLHLWTLPVRWSPVEILTALFVVTPTRLVEPSLGSILVQATFVGGAIVLWQFLRRRTDPWIAAGVILLLAVSVPGDSLRLALVPWVLVSAVWGMRRDGWVEKAVIAALSLVVAKWLGAVVILVMLIETVTRSVEKADHAPVIVPALSAIPANAARAVLPVLFFPALASRVRVAVPVASVMILAFVVRPSIGPVIVASGLILASGQMPVRSSMRGNRALALSSLVVAGLVLLFSPWSGAVVARPPALLPVIPLLVVAGLGLVPAVFGRYAGLVGLILFLSAAVGLPRHGGRTQEIGRELNAGESTVIEVARDQQLAEIRIAGANVAGEEAGTELGTLELLASAGDGFSMPIRIGEVADWGAFRPQMVLRTWNPRPDLPSEVDGHGIGAWVRGTGRIAISEAISPRWLVITASDQLGGDEKLIIEEIVFR